MNYELAKQLKDVGFPIKEWEGKGKVVILPNMEGSFALPTLSELIEVCGDEFYILKRINSKSWIVEWRDGPGVVCETPEDAVAWFWLEINKKKNV
jgi:hypothetical protein